MNSADIARMINMLERSHIALHTLDGMEMNEPGSVDGPEAPTVMVTLTQRDLVLLGAGLPAIEFLFRQQGIECAGRSNLDLQNRIVEVTEAQHPEWLMPEES